MDYKAQILASIPEGFEVEKRQTEELAVLFCSFDLVNSTSFKAAHKEWPVVISKFYDISVKEIQNVSEDFKIWKFVGDEVLLYKVVDSFERLALDTKNLFHAVNSVVDQINAVFPFARNYLSVKGTVWLAHVVNLPPVEVQKAIEASLRGGNTAHRIPNMMIPVLSEDFVENRDFLGPDVDTGFRVSKYADKRKLVVSANLARCLMLRSPRESINLNDFKVVAKHTLKGVWADRPYPIIWYHDDWNKIESTFYYDETDTNPQIKAVIDGKVDDISTLAKIYTDLNKQGEIEELLRVVDQSNGGILPPAGGIVNRSKLAEVHCAAICFRKDGKILLGKRPTGKRRLAEKWEFGCGQIHLGQDFHDCIRESYREDFSAQVAYISAVPVQTYVIDGDRKVPGLLFYAEVDNWQEVDKHFVAGKHTAIDWFDPDEVEKIEAANYVPGFRETVKMALAYRLEHRNI